MERQKSDFIMKFKIMSLEITDPPLYENNYGNS